MVRTFKVYEVGAFGGNSCEHEDGYVEVQHCNSLPCTDSSSSSNLNQVHLPQTTHGHEDLSPLHGLLLSKPDVFIEQSMVHQAVCWIHLVQPDLLLSLAQGALLVPCTACSAAR